MIRRDFLSSVADGAVATWLGANAADLADAHRYVANTPLDAPYEFLTDKQAKLFDAISAQIVPTDETPGAREAQVVRFVDHALATFNKDAQPRLTEALDDFEQFTRTYLPDMTPFVAMESKWQIAALTDYERMRPQRFNLFRNLTMAGLFTHPMHGGNYEKIGWRMIGFADQFSWAPPFGYYDRA